MVSLGISAFYHDSAAALIVDGKIIAAAQEERFTRKKHDASFPIHAVKYCLEAGGYTIDDLDAIAFYDKPFLKFERLLDTYYAFAPKGISSFIKSIPIWLKEKLFLKREIYRNLKQIGNYDKKKLQLLFPEHHLSHAASAFYPSNFKAAAILTIDGVGEWATASICYGNDKEISVLKELRFPNSLGLLYSAFTYYLGFKVNSGEYKLMGLAPYGNPESEEVKNYVETIKKHLVTIREDGSIYLNQKYFTYATGLRMVPDRKWEQLFGFPKRKPTEELQEHHCNLAYAIQQVTEKVVLLMAKEAKRITGCTNLCLAGGVALNCVANGKLDEAAIFENIFITPAAGDAGGALGAAYISEYIYFDQEREITTDRDKLQGSYLGPDITENDIKAVITGYTANAEKTDLYDTLNTRVASLISKGNIIGWVQGRMEFGPRALGNRSILADPRNEETQKKLNLKIKYRESFRPFAPSVLAEDAGSYFKLDKSSPYMGLVKPVRDAIKNPLPKEYSTFNITDKLYYNRSTLPAITHVDYSARIQTVHKETNPIYWELINAFKNLTGCPVLVNTSFNVRGEPIVMTAEDAYRCFMRTEMDYLVIGNYLFDKRLQPKWNNTDNWKEEFILD